MKARVRCKKCSFEMEVDLKLQPSGSLKPGAKIPSGGLKIDKDSLDKILDSCKGASRDELEKIGLRIPINEWEKALERQALRRFLLENIKVCKTEKLQHGEKYVVATEPWTMGDTFRDVDLASSEVKSMGVDDMRMIPGLTMQKKVYGITKGRDNEELKGVKFIVIIDCSGSMITGDRYAVGQGKIARAFLVGKEIWDFTKKLGFDYKLALYSDQAVKVNQTRMKEFWTDIQERSQYGIFNGGTRLKGGLEQFTDAEYKDANVVIISDMDLGDFSDSKEKIVEITKQTNSFKIILIDETSIDLKAREKQTRDLFPNDINLKVLVMLLNEEKS